MRYNPEIHSAAVALLQELVFGCLTQDQELKIVEWYCDNDDGQREMKDSAFRKVLYETYGVDIYYDNPD